MIREGLELNQIPIFVGYQCMERDGLTLGRKFGLFIWTPCLQLFGRVGFSSLILQLFFSKIPSLFAEMILITLEFHDEKTLYGMICYMVETFGSRWEWAGPDLALNLALWPQGQFVRPWTDPIYHLHVSSLVQWAWWVDPFRYTIYVKYCINHPMKIYSHIITFNSVVNHHKQILL